MYETAYRKLKSKYHIALHVRYTIRLQACESALKLHAKGIHNTSEARTQYLEFYASFS